MFNKSRNKIILSIMGSLVLLLVVTLAAILLANARETRQRSEEMLREYVELYSLRQKPEGFEEPPPDGAPPPFDARVFELSTFYSVALAEDGSALAVDTGMKEVYSEEELVKLARSVLGKTSGKVDTLLFRTARKDGYMLVAFLDNTVTDSGLRTLLRQALIVGAVAIVALFFASVELAKRIIRPLEENDRRQKRFISDASHELKTPVSVIDANAELLSRELGENEWLANIRYASERMGELVRQLLDLSRAENTESPTELVDFSRVLAGEALAFESLAFEQGKTIRSEIEPDVHVQGNPSQLTQLASVLLDNAIRHSTGAEIELSLKRQGRDAILRVANEGASIPPEQLSHLFDRFYRVDEARGGEGRHYGLGLSIAKAVAEKHGGSIGVACPAGKVVFTVTLSAKI